VLLLLAGNETTRNLITCLLNVAADSPDIWRALGEDRALIGPAIERVAAVRQPGSDPQPVGNQATTLGGHAIAAGQNVAVAYAGGNRDPRQFAEPERFVVDRRENRHLAFGVGIHFCLGAPLARLETAILIEHMLDRYATISRSGPPVFQRAARVVRGLTSLHSISVRAYEMNPNRTSVIAGERVRQSGGRDVPVDRSGRPEEIIAEIRPEQCRAGRPRRYQPRLRRNGTWAGRSPGARASVLWRWAS